MTTHTITSLTASLAGAGGALATHHAAAAIVVFIVVLLTVRTVDLLSVVILQRIGFTPKEATDFLRGRGKSRGS